LWRTSFPRPSSRAHERRVSGYTPIQDAGFLAARTGFVAAVIRCRVSTLRRVPPHGELPSQPRIAAPRRLKSTSRLASPGPFGSFEGFSNLSTSVMIVLMWIGRLELIPVLVLLTRPYWRL
jgi:trk system potassium uptake protein TrkH